jgi:sphingomyelin phosphodiesterase
MKSSFDLVYGAVGNHDNYPVNSFPSETIANSSTEWLYKILSSQWSDSIGAAATKDVEKGGRYSTKVPGHNLRIISINTNFYYYKNFWLYKDPLEKDPQKQLGWLMDELEGAQKAKENVYIIGHMPMAFKGSFQHTADVFDQILTRYSSTVAAMFFGHTELDQVQITYADPQNKNFSNAIATSYIAPSLAPSRGMPAFRVYDVDPDTFGVLDMKTYIADMRDPKFQERPVWKKYYSAKASYGVKLNPPVNSPQAELTPAFWHNVTELFESDTTLLNTYCLRKTRGLDRQPPKRRERKQEICTIRGGRDEKECRSSKEKKVLQSVTEVLN